jgi:hypothetical protein
MGHDSAAAMIYQHATRPPIEQSPKPSNRAVRAACESHDEDRTDGRSPRPPLMACETFRLIQTVRAPAGGVPLAWALWWSG